MGATKFRYVVGDTVEVDKEGAFRSSLRARARKIRVWWDERGRKYRAMGYRFIGVTVTFRNEEAYEDFLKWGGRKRFMKEWRRQKGNEGEIVDYVCVAEFQKRGMLHYHYLVVVSGRVSYPDKTFFRWGQTNIRELGKGGVKYLGSYISKLEQLDYEAYLRWKEKFGRFRLYEFGQGLRKKESTGGDNIAHLMRLVSRGWGWVVYKRHGERLKQLAFKFDRGLDVAGLRVEPVWHVRMGVCGVRLTFLGFAVQSEGMRGWVRSLDDLLLGLGRYLEMCLPYEGEAEGRMEATSGLSGIVKHISRPPVKQTTGPII